MTVVSNWQNGRLNPDREQPEGCVRLFGLFLLRVSVRVSGGYRGQLLTLDILGGYRGQLLGGYRGQLLTLDILCYMELGGYRGQRGYRGQLLTLDILCYMELQ